MSEIWAIHIVITILTMRSKEDGRCMVLMVGSFLLKSSCQVGN